MRRVIFKTANEKTEKQSNWVKIIIGEKEFKISVDKDSMIINKVNFEGDHGIEIKPNVTNEIRIS